MEFSKEKLSLLLSLDYENAITSHKAEVIAFYAYLFNDPNPCASCQGKIKAYWQKLHQNGLNLLNQKQMKNNQKQNSLFSLRSEITSLQMDFGSAEFFNNETLTDEIALRYLKINPKRIANFETYPQNWKTLLEQEPRGRGKVKREK